MSQTRRVQFDARDKGKGKPRAGAKPKGTTKGRAKRKQSWSRRHRRELAPVYLALGVLFTGWVLTDVPDAVKWILINSTVVVLGTVLLTRKWADRQLERAVIIALVAATGAWLLAASQLGITRPLLYSWTALSFMACMLWWADWFQITKTRTAAKKAKERRIRAGAWHTDAGLTAAFTEAGLIRPGRDGEPPPAPKRIDRPDTDDYGTTVRVRLPRGVRYSQVEAARESLAAALDQPIHLVTISQLRGDPAGVARIRVALPYERTIRTHPLPETTSWRDPVVIGRDRRGRDVTIPTWNIGQVLVGGLTGSGKTQFLRLLAAHYGLDPEASLYVVDGKGSSDDWGPLRARCKRLLFIHDDDPAAKFADLLEHVQGIVTERNRQGGRDWPGVLVILEEFSSLLASLDPIERKDMERAVTRLVQTCRSANVMVVIAAQRPSASTMDTNTRAQAAVSVALAMKSASDFTMVLGHTPTLELPDLPGESIVVVPGRDDVFVDLDTLPDGDWADLCAQWAAKASLAAPALTGVPAATQPSLLEDPTEVKDDLVAFTNGLAEAGFHPDLNAELRQAERDEDLELLAHAAELVITTQFGSSSMLQRKLRIGYAMCGRVMDLLENAGIVGPHIDGQPARDVLVPVEDKARVLAELRGEPAPDEHDYGPDEHDDEPESEPEKPVPSTAREAVLHLIREASGEVHSTHVQLALDTYSRSSVKTALSKLVADGEIVRKRQGVYEAAGR